MSCRTARILRLDARRGCTTSLVDEDRQQLRNLSQRLIPLHLLLLERERRVYEERNGAVGSRELLHLLLHDAHFAWLRPLSTLMAEIDAMVDADDPDVPFDAARMLRRTHQLLKSGDRGAFQDKYREALQDSPDLVMAHASVSELLRRAG